MTQAIDDLLLERLKQEIASDLKPEEPLAPAWKRALFLFPVWGTLLALSVGGFGIRNDYEILGPWAAWVLALIQLAVAYLLAIAGLRLVIPGALLAAGSVRLAAILAIASHLGIAAITFQRSPVPVAADRIWELWAICFLITLMMSLLPLAAAAVFASKGLPFSPISLGALCGLGAGLAGEAAWRMHCHYTAWEHILAAHTSAVVAAAIVGALAGYLWRRRQIKLRH
ncbi:MAG TPA: NrsF family protein [Acidobacteriota bacterium]|nr:NrsF family protein [Acidobacteriota bacterium]